MNHGVFSFGESAKQSYDRMISIVSEAEKYLKNNNAWRKYSKFKMKEDLLELCKIRRKASELFGNSCVAKINQSPEAVGFSRLNNSVYMSKRGTLTPDHVIRTKPFPWIINKDLDMSAKSFTTNYSNYFEKNAKNGIKRLDSAPRWALWKNYGTISFGTSLKSANIVHDINNHTIRAMQLSNSIDSWKPISHKELFEVEYWDLEQAKLRNKSLTPEFLGKIAIITGTASGIGFACAEKLLNLGCVVVGLDKNKKVKKIFNDNVNYLGLE